ncbi:hypothetical protein INR49_027645 [Caranx melampygus]|nr:hypothetical protein INR49_027645 [Caranx melampygus]
MNTAIPRDLQMSQECAHQVHKSASDVALTGTMGGRGAGEYHIVKGRGGLTVHMFRDTGVRFRVTQGNVTVEVDLIIIPNELEDSHMESAGERYAVLSHANGVVLDVWTPGGSQTSKE